MNLPQPNHRAGGPTRLSGIVRLVRRVCVLRERGEAAAAARLEENDFATAVRDLRLAEGPDAVTAEELQAMFAAEEERVANAAVLAELLVPQLRGALADGAGPSPAATVSARRETPAPFAVARVTEPVAGSPAITDLLDAMLAADGAARRQSSGRRSD